MKWLYIIDNWDEINPETDTTYPIILESARRGISTYVARISDLAFNKIPYVMAKEVDNGELAPKEKIALNDFDFIFMRKEPPYDLAFHYSTKILSLAEGLVLNSPQSLRNFNEKLIIMNFPHLLPDTLVSARTDEIIEFSKKHEFVIIKSLRSHQGRGVAKITHKDIEKINEYSLNGTELIMVQEFIPNVVKGDKRILLLGGKYLGSVNRIPKEGDFRSNFGQGGHGEQDHLSQADLQIIDEVGPWLVENHIHFAGLDVIDGKLTEINITCPTGLQHINKIEGKLLERDVVDYFIQLLEK